MSKEKKPKKDKRYQLPPFTRFTGKDRTLFAKRLSFLVQAGVPILESLKILQQQTKGKGLIKMYELMIEDVANGKFLHDALAKFPNLFSDFVVNIVRIGEMGGALPENLNYMAEELKKKGALKRKIIGALVYPIFITVATLAITGLLTVYIFPRIMPIFQSLDADLPITTITLIGISTFLQDYGWLVILLIIAGTIAFSILHKRVKPFRMMVDWVLIKTPLIKELVRNYNLSNISRTLSLLLKSGLPITEALAITSDTTVNLIYKKHIRRLSEQVIKGEKLATYLSTQTKVFPGLYVNTIAVGERTGRLGETFTYLAELHENDVDELTKNLSTTVEPLLMVFMGIIVGFVAISVITPIYDITQHLQS